MRRFACCCKHDLQWQLARPTTHRLQNLQSRDEPDDEGHFLTESPNVAGPSLTRAARIFALRFCHDNPIRKYMEAPMSPWRPTARSSRPAASDGAFFPLPTKALTQPLSDVASSFSRDKKDNDTCKTYDVETDKRNTWRPNTEKTLQIAKTRK